MTRFADPFLFDLQQSLPQGPPPLSDDPFGRAPVSFPGPPANQALFDSLIDELLNQRQPEILPAPDLSPEQLLQTEFDRRFPSDPARRQVEVRRRQLGESIPTATSPPEQLADFEQEIKNRRQHLENEPARQPLIDIALANRFRDVDRITDDEGLRLERFLDQADDEQLRGFATTGTERREAIQEVERREAIPDVVRAGGEVARRLASGATGGASEALITMGPTGAEPLPGPVDRFRQAEGLPEKVAAGAAAVTSVVEELGGFAAGLAVSGIGRLSAGLAQRLGVTNLVARRAIEAAAALGLFETLTEVPQAGLRVAQGQPVGEAGLQALEEIGVATAVGGVLGGAFGGVEAGVKAIRAARAPQGVRTPLREPLPVEPAPPTEPIRVEVRPVEQRALPSPAEKSSLEPGAVPAAIQPEQVTRARAPDGVSRTVQVPPAEPAVSPNVRTAAEEILVATGFQANEAKRVIQVAIEQGARSEIEITRAAFRAGRPSGPQQVAARPVPRETIVSERIETRAQPHPGRTRQELAEEAISPVPRPEAEVRPVERPAATEAVEDAGFEFGANVPAARRPRSAAEMERRLVERARETGFVAESAGSREVQALRDAGIESPEEIRSVVFSDVLRGDVQQVLEGKPLSVRTKFKVVPQGSRELAGNVGDDLVAVLGGVDDVIRLVEQNTAGGSGKQGAQSFVEAIEKGEFPASAEDLRLAREFRAMTTGDIGSRKLARDAQKKGVETVKADELKLGDTFEVAGEKHTVRRVEPSGEIEVVNGIDAVQLPFDDIIIDKGTLRLASTVAKGPQAELGFGGKTVEGGQLVEGGVVTAEGKLKPETSKEATKGAELEATDEGQAFIKLAGKFLGEINMGVPVDKVVAVLRTQLGQKVVRWGTYVPGYGIYARPLIRIVERQGGATGKLLARMARRFADRAREFEGRVAPTRLAVEVRFRAKIKERNRMQQLTRAKNSNDSFHAKTQLIIENRAVAEGADQKFWEAGYRRLLVITGKMAEEVGARVFTAGGGSRPFRRAMQANKFIRIPSPQFMEAMFTHSSLFEKVVDELLVLNNMASSERGVAMEFLDQWNGPKAERVVGAIERARLFKVFPTHVRHNGKIVQILETDPVRSLRGPGGFIPDRAAFIEGFGNNFGVDSELSRLRLEFSREGGRIRDFDNLIAAMHDRPIGLFGGQPVRLVTQNMGLIPRLAIAGLNPIWRGFVLSASVIPNMTEVIAKVPAHAGARRMLRTLVKMAGNPIKNKRELLAAGSITADTMDFMIQEMRKIEDVGRIGIEGLTRLFASKFQNEFNEQFSAAAGKLMRDDIERGAMGFLDRQRLFILDYTPGEVRAMARGTASKRLLDSIPGRIAAATQGTTRKRVERSLAANNPLFKFAFDFQSYMQITLERGGRVLRNLPEAYARGGVVELAAASVIAAEFFTGQAVAGIGSLLLRGLVFGGAVVLGKGIVDWMYSGLLESGMAGPLRTLQWVNPGQSLADIAFKFSAKGRLFNDIYDAVSEQRGFANKRWAEIVVELLRRQVPAHRAAAPLLTRTQSAYLVAIGLRDPQLSKARRAYFDWVNKNVPRVGGKAPGFNQFRREMSNVVTWIRAGNEKRAYQAVAAAFKAAIEEETGSIPEGLDVPSLEQVSPKVWNRVKSSLRAQRLISGPRIPKRLLPKLRKDIGEENVRLLMLEDLILDLFIKGVFTLQPQREAARKRLRKAG